MLVSVFAGCGVESGSATTAAAGGDRVRVALRWPGAGRSSRGGGRRAGRDPACPGDHAARGCGRRLRSTGGRARAHLCSQRAASNRWIVARSELVGKQLEDDQEARDRGDAVTLRLGTRRRRAAPMAGLARRAVVPVPCPASGRTGSVIAAFMLVLAFASATAGSVVWVVTGPPLPPPPPLPLVCVATG